MGIKKIAILCNYELLPDRVGGMDYFFWEFDRKCKKNGIDVDWFFPNASKHGEYQNLNCIDCNFQIEKHFLKQPEIADYTHIVTHFLEICTSFFYKIKSKSNAYIITVDHNSRPLKGYGFKKMLQKKIKGIVFSRYIDRFIGVSDYTVKELKKDFGDRISKKTVTIYNGIDYEKIAFRNEISQEVSKIIVVSYLRESKGIQDLIKAIAILPDFIKEKITIDIYGYGPYKEILLQKIRERNLTNFNFMGSFPNLKDIYFNYDYMILPTHMECFNLSILESLAANVPVITTDVGGNQEAVKHGLNGFIFQVYDTEDLAYLIQEVFSGKKQLIENTRELVEKKFSLKKMVDEHFKLIQ